MKIITEESLIKLLNLHGFDNFMGDVMKSLRRDFGRWHTFAKIPRPGMRVSAGVLELMPICDNELYYTFKYVNLHPKNPSIGKQTIVATGQLVSIATGYPLMFSEMTILTALRTAATSALAADFMARKNAKTLAIIGTGAQSEFQVKAMQIIRGIKEVRYFDIDAKAMDKFEKNLSGKDLRLIRCKSAKEATQSADIITVCTVCYGHMEALKKDWVKAGVHINAIGGDSKGKTELEASILPMSRIVVEYFDQSKDEGEIQVLEKSQAKKLVYGELYELINGFKCGRENEREITLFDSVGIALEDYSVLRLTYELAQKYHIGEELNMTPVVTDPKDLFALLN
ncbi:ornithine cyclodeaminase [Candidatus Gottesmanbacteria bacterium]|nr:ornithine cyclodeaminase [Candidatus Gottesmanbacteria bacterium]